MKPIVTEIKVIIRGNTLQFIPGSPFQRMAYTKPNTLSNSNRNYYDAQSHLNTDIYRGVFNTWK